MAGPWKCTEGHQFESLPEGVTSCPTCGKSLTPHSTKLDVDPNLTIDAPSNPSVNQPQPETVEGPQVNSGTPTRQRSMPSFSSLADSSLLSHLEIPGYEILSELGRGGMGVVYKARQRGLNRIVALKMILAAEHAGIEQRARFIAEAEAVAQLQTPHIVQIYEIGEVDGRPFFSLEYVDGGSLAQKLQGNPQPPRSAASLVETLARGVAIAHAIGIIHRDLKPANVLLANPLGAESPSHRTISTVAMQAQHPFGIPKITDFGLAKRLEGGTGQTQTGSILGTPSYMAPEQASGKIKDICPATDVYSLGAILYELLVGKPPFVGENPVETIMRVIRDEPIPPSKLQPKTPRDLEIITMKCLEKGHTKRYQTATELADDLGRFLEGEPISARPATPTEKVRKWIRRHPAGTGFILIGFVALIALVTVGLIYNANLQEALEQTRKESQALAKAQENNLQRMIRLTVSNGTQLVNQRDFLRALPWFAEALRLEKGVAEKEEMHRIRIASVLRECPRLLGAWFHDGRVNDGHFSPDGKYVVTACEDGFARIYPVGDLEEDEPKFAFKHPGGVLQARFSPTGKQILTICSDYQVRVWSVDSSSVNPITSIKHEGKITSASFNAVGDQILTTSEDRTAGVWDAMTGERTVTLNHTLAVLNGEFSPDGKQIATACADGTARVWSAKSGEAISQVLTHQGPVVCARFSPDGERVLTASRDLTVRVWEAKTGLPYSVEIRRNSPLTDAAYSPNGRDILMSSEDGTARIWNVELKDWRTYVVRHDTSIRDLEFSPDGRSFTTGSDDNTARVWDVVRGNDLTPPLRHNGTVYRTMFSPDGATLLTASQDGLVRIWDISTGRRGEAVTVTRQETSLRVAYSPDRRQVIKTSSSGETRIFSAATDEPLTPVLKHNGAILHTAFSPDGTRVITTSSDRTARIWNARTGEPIGVPMKHGSDVVYATFSPDGSQIATAGSDNMACIWNAKTGKPTTPPLRHNGTVNRVVFSLDGRCLLTSSEDGTARVWDCINGEPVTPPQKPTGWMAQTLGGSEQSTGWDLPPVQKEVLQLRLMAQWLSAQRYDDMGGLVPLDMEALRLVWKDLRKDYSADFVRTSQEMLDWHRREAESAEMAREWFAARFHLDRLIQAEEGSQVTLRTSEKKSSEVTKNLKLSRLYARRATTFAERRLWKEASLDFDKSLETGSDDEKILTAAALTHLAAGQMNDGNMEGYRKACAKLLEVYGPSAHGESASRLGWVCLLAPDSKCMEQEVGEIGRKAIGEKKDHPGCMIVDGAAKARLGQFQEAIKQLVPGQVLAEPLDAVRGWLYLTIVYHQLDQRAESQRWFAQAELWMNRNCNVDPRRPGKISPLPWQQRLELELLHREIEQTIKKTLLQERIEKIDENR